MVEAVPQYVADAAVVAELLPLDPVGFRQAIEPAPDVGTAGRLEWLSICDLRIDPRYQRPITAAGLKTIRAIVEGFDWAKFSPIVVGERPGGLYAVIDGQHRATAAATYSAECEARGGDGLIYEVPCLILSGGPEVEAGAFAIINGQVTNVTPTQIHVARVMAGDKRAMRLEQIIGRGGARIVKNPPSTWKVGDSISVVAVEWCLKRFGADTLITALQCITETDDGNPGMVKGALVKGLCFALESNRAWRDAGESLFAAIEKVGIRGIYRTAQKLKAETGKGSEWVHIAAVARKHLERTLGENPRPRLAAPAADNGRA